MGGTPYYVTAVWWGYDAPYDMTKTLSKQQAKTRTCVMAWKALMEQAQAELESSEYTATSGGGAVEVTISGTKEINKD